MGGGEQYFLRKGKYLLNLQSLLRYGVTVALQILVLSVEVRIPLSQPLKKALADASARAFSWKMASGRKFVFWPKSAIFGANVRLNVR